MVESAVDTTAGKTPISKDFHQNYDYLKDLLKALKTQNNATVRKAIFGDTDPPKKITKKPMKQSATFLRKVERQCEECATPPIPDELESAIRDRESSEWLPWEMEAIEKVDAWREEVHQRRSDVKKKIRQAIEVLRDGKDLNELSGK